MADNLQVRPGGGSNPEIETKAQPDASHVQAVYDTEVRRLLEAILLELIALRKETGR